MSNARCIEPENEVEAVTGNGCEVASRAQRKLRIVETTDVTTDPTARAVTPFNSPAGLTCQICGGQYNCLEGFVANHGFKREAGFNTAGCDGSRHRPFENSRDTIPEAIETMERHANGLAADLATLLTSSEPADHVVRHILRQITHAKVQINNLEQRYDAWVQTISDEEWQANRDAMHPKRSSATAKGWTLRDRGSSATHRIEEDERDEDEFEGGLTSTSVIWEGKAGVVCVQTFASGSFHYVFDRATDDDDDEDRCFQYADDPGDFNKSVPRAAKAKAVADYKERNALPETKATGRAFIVENGIQVAMFTYTPAGRIFEAIANGSGTWDLIDTHDDLTTVPTEIARQLGSAAA